MLIFESYFLVSPTQCSILSTICPAGEYYDLSTCIKCSSNCLTCSSKSDYCESCDPSQPYLYLNKCYSKCPGGWAPLASY